MRHHPIITLRDGVGFNVPCDVKQYILEDMKGDLELYLYFDFMDHKERLDKVHKRLLLLSRRPIYLRCIQKRKEKPLSIKIITKPPVDKWREYSKKQQDKWKAEQAITILHPKESKWPKPLKQVKWTKEFMPKPPYTNFACKITSRLYAAPYALYRENKHMLVSKQNKMIVYDDYASFSKQYPLWSEEEWKLIKGIFFYRD